ncbi:MAG: hypothetical protein WD894_12875 [Pirellulales bacterium]
MSTTKSAVKDDAKVDVIIRGFADRPGHLIATGRAPGVVYAVGEDEAFPMGFHAERVYAFEKELYDDLEAAFDRSNSAQLVALWSRARPLAEVS